MVIEFKDGVPIKGLKAIIYQAIFVAAKIFNNQRFPLVVTSTTDGKHLPTSFHNHGMAFDIRTRSISEAIVINIAAQLRVDLNELSDKFQVVVEPTHIHVELDDRRLINET